MWHGCRDNQEAIQNRSHPPRDDENLQGRYSIATLYFISNSAGLQEDKEMIPQDNLLSLLRHFSTFSPEMTEYVYQSLKVFSE